MLRRIGTLGLPLLLLAALLVWWHSRPDGRLHLLFPALRGDAVLVVTPAGRTLLVDGGADPAALPQLLGRRLPAWQRRIDLLVLTRADPQRLPGLLAVARRYAVGQAVLPAAPHSEQEHALLDVLLAGGARVLLAAEAGRIELDGLQISLQRQDDQRLALWLEYGTLRGLLAAAAQPGDLGGVRSQPAQLLFYPWDGPDDRTLAEQLGAQLIVYGEGLVEPAGPPRTYLERGADRRRLLHEQLDGEIELVSDGTRLWLHTSRP